MLRMQVIEQEMQPVMYMTATTSIELIPETISTGYRKIMEYLQAAGVSPAGSPYTAYHNQDMSSLLIEMGFPVTKALPGTDEIKAGEISAGKYVTTVYKGPYTGIQLMFEDVFKWIDENGFDQNGAYYEYYVNSPDEVDENELLTKIIIPIIKKG